MLVGVGQDDALDLRVTRSECLVNHGESGTSAASFSVSHRL